LLGYRVHAANTLSEDDAWRHIHENSHVQSGALSSLSIESGAENAAFQASLALLKNESFHPLPLLLYLIHRLAGVPNSRMEALTSGQGGTWLMQKIAERSASPQGIFHSVRQLAEREQTIVAQHRLIEERFEIIQRMRSEVANRDEIIAGQAELIEERWRVMTHMTQEIANRDDWIADLQARLGESERVLATREGELAGLYANHFVRMLLFVRRRWIGLRSWRIR
jgi:hypothetical protein